LCVSTAREERERAEYGESDVAEASTHGRQMVEDRRQRGT
jgi:hypothetical protein